MTENYMMPPTNCFFPINAVYMCISENDITHARIGFTVFIFHDLSLNVRYFSSIQHTVTYDQLGFNAALPHLPIALPMLGSRSAVAHHQPLAAGV